MDNEKYFMKILLQSGCSVTQQRLLVLSFLYNHNKPISIETIIKKLKVKKIDRATVYRILKIFQERNIVNQIDMKEDRAYYELKDKNDHHHIICVECKEIEDFDGCDYKDLIVQISKKNKKFAKITNHSFELFGICKSCI